MPMTLSTIYGGASGVYRKVFGLISSASTDGTALSLTIAHSLGAAWSGLNATNATQLINATFTPNGDNSATGAFGWFVTSIDATNCIVGRSSVGAGAGATALTYLTLQLNNSLVQ